MIELYSKKAEWMDFDSEDKYMPVFIDEDISSLSAILLNECYYDFLRNGTEIVEGVTVLNAEHIIPFKAKAWLDMMERKKNGEHVDSRDIRKHRNDVFRLSLLLCPENNIV